jgi:hypothetical protein
MRQRGSWAQGQKVRHKVGSVQCSQFYVWCCFSGATGISVHECVLLWFPLLNCVFAEGRACESALSLYLVLLVVPLPITLYVGFRFVALWSPLSVVCAWVSLGIGLSRVGFV